MFLCTRLSNMLSNTKINSLVAFKSSKAASHKTKTLSLVSTRQIMTKTANVLPYTSNNTSRTTKPVDKRPSDSVSPKAEKSLQGGNASGATVTSPSGGASVTSSSSASVTSSFVAALRERGGGKGRRGRESLLNNKTSSNRADRLQVMLNMLELEMGRLQQREKQLEQRLSRFMVQRSSLASTIDDLHLRLDTLGCNHKSLARKESPKRKL